MAAFNYATFAQLSQSPLKKGLIMNIIRHSPIMERLNFIPVNALENTMIRVESLPDVAFRKINAGYTAGGGAYGQVQESVYAFGGELEFDRVFAKLGNAVVDPMTTEILTKTMAMAFKFNDYFINGDHATDADGFEGLKKRISNMPARQLLAANSTDILDPTASAANARKFIKLWNKAHYRANGGDVAFIAVNEALMWGFLDVLMYANIGGGNLVDTTKDLFDREVLTYKGAPFVDMGFKKDMSTEIITVTEDPGDGGNDGTSAYFVPVNEENGVTGIQLSDLEIYDPLDGGEQESKPVKMIRMEHWCGIATPGNYGPTRLYGIENPDSWT